MKGNQGWIEGYKKEKQLEEKQIQKDNQRVIEEMKRNQETELRNRSGLTKAQHYALRGLLMAVNDNLMTLKEAHEEWSKIIEADPYFDETG